MTNAVTELATHPLVERLGWTLVHFVWQAMIVSVLAAVALRLFRNATANGRYVGLCAGLLVLAAAPVFTFIAIPADAEFESDGNVAGDSRMVSSASAVVDHVKLSGEPAPPLAVGRDAAEGGWIPVAEPNEREGVVSTSSGRPSDEVRLDGTKAAASSLDARPAPSRTNSTLRLQISAAAPWIVAVWILGVAVLSVWHTTGWLMARRLTTRGTQPVSAATNAVLDSLKQRMEIRVSVRLLESTAASVPIVVGWLKPVLLMPASVLTGLPPDQLKAILAHELAHVRRHDFLINLLQTCVETCLFYHPAVWWLSRQIRIEREYCADEEAAMVCEDRDTYARALVSLADSVMAVPRPAVAATGGSLTRRIQRLLGLVSDRERAARRPSWLVSALLGLAVICSLIASTESNARQSDAKPDELNEVVPIKEIADRLEKCIDDWQLLAVDNEPSVTVAGHQGFRVVLRRTWKEYINPPQQTARAVPNPDDEKFNLKTDDWEFVLFPDEPKLIPVALKSQIKWKDRKSPYHTRDVCMGTGHGYVWFSHATIFDQEHVRDALKLKGGDDRIQLAIDGVLVKDTNMHTSEICRPMPAKFGDRAIPYIKRAVEQWLAKPRETGLWRLVSTLGFIPTSRSTATLLQLFDFPNAEVQSCAESGLCHEPYRKAAKRAYLDMLRRNSRVRPVVDACVEFEWTESIPLMRDVIAHPRDLQDLRAVLLACRSLEGNPIGQELFVAENDLRWTRPDPDADQKRKIESARRLLIQSNDVEAANLAALWIAIPRGKRSSPVPPVGLEILKFNALGIEILKSRPRESTVAFLKRVSESIGGFHGTLIKEILVAVSGPGRETSQTPPIQGAVDPFGPLDAATPPVVLPPDPFQRRAIITPTMVDVPGSNWQIATTPVTNAQYQEFLDATGLKWPVVTEIPETTGSDRGYPWKHLLASDGTFVKGRGKFPVALVTREEAEAYCRWLGPRLAGEFTLAPNDVYSKAVLGSRGVSVGRDELKRLGRPEVLDGTHRMWFPLAEVDAYPQHRSKLNCQVQGQSFYELTQKGVSQPNAWRNNSTERFLFEMHGPAQRLCVIGFRVARNMDLQVNTVPGDSTWVNSVNRIEDRDKLYAAHQKVRGSTRSNGDRFHHWSALPSGSDRELNAHFNSSARASTSLSPWHDNVLLFRSRQLNDNDRMWIERVERDGDLFTVTAHRATWNGTYTRNLTYYDVFSVNVGKLPPGAYRAKWIIKPLDFGESDELDGQGRPIVEQPSRQQKQTELTTQFTIIAGTAPGNEFAPDDLGPRRLPSQNGVGSPLDPVTPRASTNANAPPRDLAYPPPTAPSPAGVTQSRPVGSRPDPVVEWGQAVKGLQAGISYDNNTIGSSARVRVGDRVSTKLTVRNIGKVAVSFTTVEPSFRIPTVTDTTGKRRHVSTIAYDGPAATLKHQLKPSESMTFDINSCSVAPRQPIYNTDGNHIVAEPGKYKLSATLLLHTIYKGDWAGRLDAGTLDLEVLPPDEEQLTKRLSAELKKRANELTCSLVYLGRAEPKLRSVMLAGLVPERPYPSNWSSAEIDKPSANALIDCLAKEGHLLRGVTAPVSTGEVPQAMYILCVGLSSRPHQTMVLWLPWSSMKRQIQKLQLAVNGKAADALGQILNQPLLSQWHHVVAEKLIGVSVEPVLYERKDDPNFYIRFRLTNRTTKDAYVDLTDYNRVFHPNQWGFQATEQRMIVDEERTTPDVLNPVQMKELIDRAADGQLTRIAPGQSVDYFREFNNGGRKDVEAQQKNWKYLIVSIDGQLRATDGTVCENVNVEWHNEIDNELNSDVAIAAPVPFKSMPVDSPVVEP